MIRYHYPPICKTCFSTSEWIWHTKKYLVNLQKFWDLGRPPLPMLGKIPKWYRFFFLRAYLNRTNVLTWLSRTLSHFLWRFYFYLQMQTSSSVFKGSTNKNYWLIAVILCSCWVLILPLLQYWNTSLHSLNNYHTISSVKHSPRFLYPSAKIEKNFSIIVLQFHYRFWILSVSISYQKTCFAYC